MRALVRGGEPARQPGRPRSSRSSKAICATPTPSRAAVTGRALRLSCRGRLPAVGARSGRDHTHQRRRHARRHEAAQAAGVERIVYTAASRPCDCDDDGTPGRRDGPLCRAGGDRRLQAQQGRGRAAGRGAWSRSDGLPAVIVNPSTPIGPRDVRPTPTGRIIVEAASGRMPAFVDTGLNLVHVDDVAAGHLAALERRPHRRALHSRRRECDARRNAGAESPLTSAAGRRACGCRARSSIPWRFAAEAVARASPAASRSSRVDGLRMAKYQMFFTSAKAERELGYRHRPVGEALRDAIAWFRAEGLPAHELDLVARDASRWPSGSTCLLFRGGFWLGAPSATIATLRTCARRPVAHASSRSFRPATRQTCVPQEPRARCSRRTIPAPSPSSWSTTERRRYGRRRHAMPPPARRARGRSPAPASRALPAGPARSGPCSRA